MKNIVEKIYNDINFIRSAFINVGEGYPELEKQIASSGLAAHIRIAKQLTVDILNNIILEEKL